MTEYIQALQRLLLQLTTAEQQDVVSYYREYLQDAGITTYQGAVDELGTPQSVARKALADYSIKMNNRTARETANKRTTGREGTKENVRMIWLIILALLSTPITIPLVLVLGALVIGFGGVVIGLVAAGLAVLFAGFVVGVVGVVVGLAMVWTAPAVGLFYLGLGLMALGVSWLLTEGVVWCARKLIVALAQFAKWAYNRWVPERPAKRGKES